MAQPVESELSVGDYQLIEANELGTPLHIYRIRPGSGRFFRKAYQLTIIVSILLLVAIILFGFIDQHHISLLLTPLFGCACIFFMGVWGLRSEILKYQSAHAIVCEYGLLQIIKKVGNNGVEVVRWTNILAVRRAFTFNFIGEESYYIDRRDGKVVVLDGCYENIQELLSLIRERSEIV